MAHNKIEQLDLNLLKVFEAIYREQHITRAAQSLHLTPSAVSHSFRRLREHLGDPLFIRSGRSMHPTPVCQRMAPELLDMLSRLRQLLQQWGKFDPRTTQQTFRIGIPDAIEAALLPGIMHILGKQAPHAGLASVPIARKDMERELATGHVEAVIDVPVRTAEPIRAARLLTDEFCVVMRPRHPLKNKLTLDAYLAARHIAVSTRASGPVVEDIALMDKGLHRKIALRCQNYHAACRVVEQSDHILTMPAGLAKYAGLAGKCVLGKLPFKLPPVEFRLYWHANNEIDPANRWLRGIVSELLLGFDR